MGEIAWMTKWLEKKERVFEILVMVGRDGVDGMGGKENGDRERKGEFREGGKRRVTKLLGKKMGG